VGFKTGLSQRRRRGIFVEPGQKRFSSSVRSDIFRTAVPRICRPDEAGDFIGSGFYKDVAPDGACQIGRVRKSTAFPFDTSTMRIHFLRMNFTESRRLPVVLPTGPDIFMTFVFLPKE
jgi:hypothetical protein